MEFITKIQNELTTSKQMDNCCYKVDSDNNLVIFYDENFNDNNTTYKYKNIIYDLTTEKPIVSQFNQPINGIDNITKFIEENDIEENVNFRFCYEGTHLVVFNHNNKWFVSTRKCLDARNSKWNGKSHYDMFIETIKGQFNLNDLNKDYCYHFNLIHYQNYRSIQYNLDENYMFLDLLFITEKYTMKDVEVNEETFGAIDFVVERHSKTIEGSKDTIINEINKQNNMTIDKINYYKQKRELEENKNLSSDELEEKKKILDMNSTNVYLEFEGAAIILKMKDTHKPVICKVQSPFYAYSYKHPVSRFDLNFPKYDILYAKYVIDTCKERNIEPIINKQVFVKNAEDTHGHFEIQKKDISNETDELNYLLSYFELDKIKIANTNIKNNMNNLAYIIKDIYFQFLKPSENYEQLPDSYKTIKYLIHGLYLNKLEIIKAEHSGEKFSINQDIIFNYLLTYNPDSIKELIIDYPNAIKVMKKIWGAGMHRYYPITYPKHIMKVNKINKIKKSKN